MKNKTFCLILLAMALMTAGCGKIRTCECAFYTPFDIVDTALADSVHGYPVTINVSYRESAMECSYWNSRDTVGQYLPEYGIQIYYVLDCYEKGEEPWFPYSEKR